MNIVFANRDDVLELGTKYIVLELDTMKLPNVDVPQIAWCVVGTDQLSLSDIGEGTNFQELHSNLMKNYRLKNWNYCIQALEHLKGKWKGELDSFYDEMSARVSLYQERDPGEKWTGVLIKI